MTEQGRMERGRGVLDFEGAVVPANSQRQTGRGMDHCRQVHVRGTLRVTACTHRRVGTHTVAADDKRMSLPLLCIRTSIL